MEKSIGTSRILFELICYFVLFRRIICRVILTFYLPCYFGGLSQSVICYCNMLFRRYLTSPLLFWCFISHHVISRFLRRVKLFPVLFRLIIPRVISTNYFPCFLDVFCPCYLDVLFQICVSLVILECYLNVLFAVLF